MFVTDIRARDPVLSQFMDEGQTVSTSVCLSGFRPWFLASYQLRDGVVSIGQTVMLTEVAQVLDLITQVGGADNGTSVSLVQPLRDAGPDRWKMTPIRKIWKAVACDATPAFDVFDLADGARFWNPFGTDVGAPTDLQLVLELDH